MKVLVLGANGMLGHKVCQILGLTHEVFATSARTVPNLSDMTGVENDHLITGVNALDLSTVERVMDRVRPDFVVNSIGVVKKTLMDDGASTAVEVNSVLPQALSEFSKRYNYKLIHISTDCVFSGDSGMYVESDSADARDLYGRSKLMGETELQNALVLRTSIVGRELGRQHGLLEWLLAQSPGPVSGYTQAYFSGIPTVTLAKLIDQIITTQSELSGCFHVASNRISKFDLLNLISAKFENRWEIYPSDEVVIDRSLNGSLFKGVTKIDIPMWSALIKELFADSVKHDELISRISI